jgi:DNA polymerase-1
MLETSLASVPVPNYEYITSSDDAGRVIDDISRYPIIEVDTETTGLDPYNAKISLVQIGVPGKSYVFDVRSDLDHCSMDLEFLKPVLTNKSTLKLLQNSVFDMKMLKVHGGYYLENIYDTMLVEQLFNLGLTGRGAGLADIILKYLGLHMTKEPQGTFQDYYQKFEKYQIDYAAADVSVLALVRDLQMPRIQKEGFENVCRLEFEFTKPMCEMELNGITLDQNKWRIIMGQVEDERVEVLANIHDMFAKTSSKPTLFGVPSVNIDSNPQLLQALKEYGLTVPNTSEGTLKKYKDVPVIKELLTYRKLNKLISTYGESLLAQINPVTCRLHTSFKQMVSTGRMSSSAPNLQNIPKKQKFRSCFIAKPGYKLITADMSGAELRILGNLSEDPVFMECFQQGLDLHSRSASEVFKVAIEDVDKPMRNSCKALSFGLCYGMSKYGLAERLSIPEKKAEKLIKDYFGVFRAVKNYLDESARLGVKNGETVTVSGRKRFYNMPPYGHPDRGKIQKAVERKAKKRRYSGS